MNMERGTDPSAGSEEILPAPDAVLPLAPGKRPYRLPTIILIHAVTVGLPTFIYYKLRLMGYSLFSLHALVATVFLTASLMIIVETSIAIFRRFAAGTVEPVNAIDRFTQWAKRSLGFAGARYMEPLTPMPPCTLIVAAYLPNERYIISETIKHILKNVNRPKAGFELILAYNSPIRFPVESELERLQKEHPEFRCLRVEGSESKAENLNAAIEIATGEICGILDADHHPAPDCLERAWHWMEKGYDVVQGRSVIRNFDANLKTKVIAVEFECMYGVSHPARSLLVDTAIFGGSNGYWKTDVLRKVRFDVSMMTEDIDASARSLLEGYRIMHDRSIISTELAPTDFSAFWFQRKRWAQGWLQVTLKYQRRFWASDKFSFLQKAYWTYLLFFREFYPLVTIQIFPIIFSLLMYEGTVPLMSHPYFLLATAVTLLSGPFQTISAAKNSFTRFPLRYSIFYALFAFFYVMIKNVIWTVAAYDHAFGNNEWIVTRRQMNEEARRKMESKWADRHTASS